MSSVITPPRSNGTQLLTQSQSQPSRLSLKDDDTMMNNPQKFDESDYDTESDSSSEEIDTSDDEKHAANNPVLKERLKQLDRYAIPMRPNDPSPLPGSDRGITTSIFGNTNTDINLQNGSIIKQRCQRNHTDRSDFVSTPSEYRSCQPSVSGSPVSCGPQSLTKSVTPRHNFSPSYCLPGSGPSPQPDPSLFQHSFLLNNPYMSRMNEHYPCRNETTNQELDPSKPHCDQTEQEFICEICHTSYANRSSLRSHMKKHFNHVAKRHQCNFCPYSTQYGKNLMKHIDSMHSGEHNQHFKCDGCSSIFATESHLNNHDCVSTQCNSYRCGECGRVFKTKLRLKYHTDIHNPRKPYVCDVDGCDRAFRTPKYLKNHRDEFHRMQPKNYVCPVEGCDIVFHRKTHLKRHVATHDDSEKRYTCQWPNCQRRFCNEETLNLHYRKHNGEKPFNCALCPFSCNDKRDLNDHYRSLHAKDDGGGRVSGGSGNRTPNPFLPGPPPALPHVRHRMADILESCSGGATATEQPPGPLDAEINGILDSLDKEVDVPDLFDDPHQHRHHQHTGADQLNNFGGCVEEEEQEHQDPSRIEQHSSMLLRDNNGEQPKRSSVRTASSSALATILPSLVGDFERAQQSGSDVELIEVKQRALTLLPNFVTGQQLDSGLNAAINELLQTLDGQQSTAATFFYASQPLDCDELATITSLESQLNSTGGGGDLTIPGPPRRRGRRPKLQHQLAPCLSAFYDIECQATAAAMAHHLVNLMQHGGEPIDIEDQPRNPSFSSRGGGRGRGRGRRQPYDNRPLALTMKSNVYFSPMYDDNDNPIYHQQDAYYSGGQQDINGGGSDELLTSMQRAGQNLMSSLIANSRSSMFNPSQHHQPVNNTANDDEEFRDDTRSVDTPSSLRASSATAALHHHHRRNGNKDQHQHQSGDHTNRLGDMLEDLGAFVQRAAVAAAVAAAQRRQAPTSSPPNPYHHGGQIATSHGGGDEGSPSGHHHHQLLPSMASLTSTGGTPTNPTTSPHDSSSAPCNVPIHQLSPSAMQSPSAPPATMSCCDIGRMDQTFSPRSYADGWPSVPTSSTNLGLDGSGGESHRQLEEPGSEGDSSSNHSFHPTDLSTAAAADNSHYHSLSQAPDSNLLLSNQQSDFASSNRRQQHYDSNSAVAAVMSAVEAVDHLRSLSALGAKYTAAAAAQAAASNSIPPPPSSINSSSTDFPPSLLGQTNPFGSPGSGSLPIQSDDRQLFNQPYADASSNVSLPDDAAAESMNNNYQRRPSQLTIDDDEEEDDDNSSNGGGGPKPDLQHPYDDPSSPVNRSEVDPMRSSPTPNNFLPSQQHQQAPLHQLPPPPLGLIHPNQQPQQHGQMMMTAHHGDDDQESYHQQHHTAAASNTARNYLQELYYHQQQQQQGQYDVKQHSNNMQDEDEGVNRSLATRQLLSAAAYAQGLGRRLDNGVHNFTNNFSTATSAAHYHQNTGINHQLQQQSRPPPQQSFANQQQSYQQPNYHHQLHSAAAAFLSSTTNNHQQQPPRHHYHHDSSGSNYSSNQQPQQQSPFFHQSQQHGLFGGISSYPQAPIDDNQIGSPNSSYSRPSGHLDDSRAYNNQQSSMQHHHHQHARQDHQHQPGLSTTNNQLAHSLHEAAAAYAYHQYQQQQHYGNLFARPNYNDGQSSSSDQLTTSYHQQPSNLQHDPSRQHIARFGF